MRKAELLAKEEQLKLIRAEDKDASVHPVFRLVTAKDFNLEQKKLKVLKQAEKKKPAKTVRLSSTISSHDLQNKVKQILEWLEKGLEVKVAIKTGKSTEVCDFSAYLCVLTDFILIECIVFNTYLSVNVMSAD